MVKTERIGFLSTNSLKLLAAAFMLIDHIGMIFFPRVMLFRIIGRVAMPIFAYMVAEGCRYTRSRFRYLLGLGICLTVCQISLFIVAHDTDLCILATFTLGAVLTFCLQHFKVVLFDDSCTLFKKLFWGIGFLLLVAGVHTFCQNVYVAYGFWGCMLPVFASLFHMPPTAPRALQKLDCKWVHIATFTVGLLLLSRSSSHLQIWCLMSIPLLLCYSGRRGYGKLKLFFYIFYPAHLTLLYGVYWVLLLI